MKNVLFFVCSAAMTMSCNTEKVQTVPSAITSTVETTVPVASSAPSVEASVVPSSEVTAEKK